MRLRRFDEWLLTEVVSRRHPVLDAVMRAVTHFGDAAVTIGICVVALTGVLPGGRPVGIQAALTLALSHGVVQVLKRTIARPRPQLPVGLGFLARAPDKFSFPSGHATAALSVALPFAFTLPAVFSVPILALAVTVGVSRSYLGVHYPGDVVMGWLLALATFGGIRLM